MNVVFGPFLFTSLYKVYSKMNGRTKTKNAIQEQTFVLNHNYYVGFFLEIILKAYYMVSPFY